MQRDRPEAQRDGLGVQRLRPTVRCDRREVQREAQGVRRDRSEVKLRDPFTSFRAGSEPLRSALTKEGMTTDAT